MKLLKAQAGQPHDDRAAAADVGQAEERIVEALTRGARIPARGGRRARLPRGPRRALGGGARISAGVRSTATCLFVVPSDLILWYLRGRGADHRHPRPRPALGGVVAGARAAASPANKRPRSIRRLRIRCSTDLMCSGSMIRAFWYSHDPAAESPDAVHDHPANRQHARLPLHLCGPSPGDRRSAPPRVEGRRGHFCPAAADAGRPPSTLNSGARRSRLGVSSQQLRRNARTRSFRHRSIHASVLRRHHEDDSCAAPVARHPGPAARADSPAHRRAVRAAGPAAANRHELGG